MIRDKGLRETYSSSFRNGRLPSPKPSYASVNRIKNVALLGPRIMNIGLCKIGCGLFGLMRLLAMLEVSVAMCGLPVTHEKSIMSTVWFRSSKSSLM